MCLKTCHKTTCLPGRIQYRTCGWDDSPPAGTDQIIFPQVVEVLTLLESVSRVAYCRQCYLPGSACRCLGSCSTTSTASTTGPLWSDIADPTFGTNPAPAGRGAGSALPYGSSATAGSSIWICLLRISQGCRELLLPFANHAPLLGGLLIWKANSWPSGMD